MNLISHILVPTDFDEPSLKALRYAATLARVVDARLSLLHVYPRGSTLAGLIGGARSSRERDRREAAQVDELHARLERFARSVPRIDELTVRLVVRSGTPGAEIPSCASDDGVDFIVLGTRRTVGGLAHRLAGGTAETTLRLAHCPVLVLRDETAAQTEAEAIPGLADSLSPALQ
jgi:nucleotide-binding universal stress UspA family protein